MKIVFAGTPAAAVPTLEALDDSEHEIVCVVTRPDAPVGRKRVLTPSPVAVAAAERGLTVLKHERLDEAATDQIATFAPDLGVVVAYGGLVRERLLRVPGSGWINLHFSVLPAFRGAAPVQRSLMAGGEAFGLSVFSLVRELDAGDLYLTESIDPGGSATASELLVSLAERGAVRTVETVAQIANGSATLTPQTGRASLAPKLTAADGLLDPYGSTQRLIDTYRGVTREPGAYVIVNEARLKIHELITLDTPAQAQSQRETQTQSEADQGGGLGNDSETIASRTIAPGTITEHRGRIILRTIDGAVELRTVQPSGKPQMPAADWWRGVSAQHLEVS